jgi:ATP-dependent DNA helicase RecG
MLLYYPREWEDRSRIVPIKDFHKGNVCSVVAVIAKDWIWSGKTKTLKVYVEDDSARASLVCYNRPWLGKQLVTGERYWLYGSFSYKYKEIQSGAFDIEPFSSNRNLNMNNIKILPVYSLTAGLNQNALRGISFNIITKYAAEIENELPLDIIERDSLMTKKEAIKNIHFPDSVQDIEKAKKALVYEELFYLEVMVGKRSLERRGCERSAIEDKMNAAYTPLQKRLLERLAFSLTEGQSKAVKEINRDMAVKAPMARLLQGDVGCGKTLVSFLAALSVIENGGQAAIMAPTELLARQHAENAARLLEPVGCKIAFLTGNIKAAGRKELLKNLLSGAVDIVVGTHALFSGDVEYKNLKLVVIDEQHRFGVNQRSLIMSKGEN